MTAKTVLFVNTPTILGGAEISILLLMKSLIGSGFRPLLVTAGRGQLHDRAQENGVRSFLMEFPWLSRKRPWRYARSILELRRIITRYGVDIIHTNCDHSLRYVRLASRLTGVPYVSHVRDFVRTWFEPYNVGALNQAEAVIANSHAIASAVVEAGIDSTKVATIYSPINVDAFRKNTADDGRRFREEHDIPIDALLVGIAGQIQPIKGHMEFIRAGIRLAALVPGVHFVVAGGISSEDSLKKYFSELRALAASSDHNHLFHFVGFQHDMPRVMRAIDVLAVPSWTEAFGRVAVEAMAAGCAVVATKTGGLEEIVAHNMNGMLIPPKDVEALVQVLHRLVTDDYLRIKLGTEAMKHAETYSLDRHVQQIRSVYRRVLPN